MGNRDALVTPRPTGEPETAPDAARRAVVAGTGDAEKAGERDGTEETISIGQLARSAGVSERTLRYYDEMGLVVPRELAAGGCRRYASSQLATVLRIRELQQLMGLNLDDIATVVRAEDRLESLRTEYRRGGEDPLRRRELAADALAIVEALRDRVQQRLERTVAFRDELDKRAARYREIAQDIA